MLQLKSSRRSNRKEPGRCNRTSAALGIESLEDRTMLSVTPFLTGPATVTFQGTPFNQDDVFLRVVDGTLQHSTNGVDFERDIDPAPGVQELAVDNGAIVQVDVGGKLFIDQFRGGGGTFKSITDIVLRDNVIVSSRRLASGADPLTAPSIADSYHLSFEAPEIVIGNGARIVTTANNGFASGDLRLTADSGFDLTFTSSLPFFKDRTASASVKVKPNAVIEANNVEISATTTTAKYTDLDFNQIALQDLLQGIVLGRMTGNPELTFEKNESGGDVIRRSEGSWIDDGFELATLIFVQGTLKNEGLYRVDSVSDLELTLTESGVLDDETPETLVMIDEVFGGLNPEDDGHSHRRAERKQAAGRVADIHVQIELIAGGDFDVSGADVRSTAMGELNARVGAFVEVEVKNDVSLGARSRAATLAEAGGFVGGVIGAGATLAEAEDKSDVSVSVGPDAQVVAGGNVALTSTHSTTFPSPNGQGSFAKATPSGGAALSGQGAAATARADGSATTEVLQRAAIQAVGNVTLRSTTANVALGFADGDNVGVAVAVGDVTSKGTSQGKSIAGFRNGSSVSARNVTIEASALDKAFSTTRASNGGAISIDGSRADVEAKPTADAFFGDNVTAEAQQNLR